MGTAENEVAANRVAIDFRLGRPPAWLFMWAGDECEASHAYMAAWCNAEAAQREMEQALADTCGCNGGVVPCPDLELIGVHEDCRYGCTDGVLDCGCDE